MKYKILDENDRVVGEKELRKLLFSYELGDLQNNEKDYFEGLLLLENQFECIKTALNGSIEQVIEMLEYNWNVPIEPIKEIEKEIIKTLLLYKEDLNSLCGRLQADYNGDKEFKQMEEDRLGLCYIMELVEELK